MTSRLQRPVDPRFADVRRLGGERYAAFLADGYREYYSPSGCHATPFLLQKAFWRDDVKLFFVNVWVYDHSDWQPDYPVGFQPEAQFNTHLDQTPTFNVTLIDHGEGPGDVERFFLSLYDRMECQPYGD